MQSIVEISYW